VAVLLFVVALARTQVTGAQTTAPAERVVTICGDPNNLPFSNQKEEGFENKIAQIVARDLDAKLAYIWRPQRRGFFRETLKNRQCDIVMGAPTTFDKALVTIPYYRSTYYWVTRRDRNLDIDSFDDPRLRTLKIGLQVTGGDTTAPAEALAERHIINNLVGYSVFGDYSQPNPPARIIDAVANGDVDVAVVWGPLAGYFARKSGVPLKLTQVCEQPQGQGLPFAFDIGMAVKKGNTPLRDQLNSIIRKRQPDIDHILDEYGIPRLPLSSSPVQSAQLPQGAEHH
jgi:mxaJ protein